MIPFYLSLKLLVAAYLKFINSKRQIWKLLKPLSMKCVLSTMFQNHKIYILALRLC